MHRESDGRRMPRKAGKGSRYLLRVMMLAIALFVLAGCGQTNDTAEIIQGTPVGEAVSTMLPSEKDGACYSVTLTITSIVHGEEALEAIQAYNVSGASSRVSESVDVEGVSYVVAYYDVAFPKDYPQSVFGITAVTPNFRICSTTGEDTFLVDNIEYSGLTDTWEIGSVPMGYDFYAGSTYHGAIVFLMVDGCTDYLIVESYQEDGVLVEHYFQGE